MEFLLSLLLDIKCLSLHDVPFLCVTTVLVPSSAKLMSGSPRNLFTSRPCRLCEGSESQAVNARMSQTNMEPFKISLYQQTWYSMQYYRKPHPNKKSKKPSSSVLEQG